MSLSIYLTNTLKCSHCGHEVDSGEVVYETNITHNLGKMAEEAGIYMYLWRPEEVGCEKSSDIIEHLELGYLKLIAHPNHYKKFNPSNGWGCYDDFVKWIEEYISALKEYPDAKIEASR